MASPITTSFTRQGSCGSTGDIYTCFRIGNTGSSSTGDLGGSGSGSNYRNTIAVRFDSLNVGSVGSATMTINFNLSSSDYASASQTITVAPCANFTNSTTGTALPTTYSGTATGSLAGRTASISIDVKTVLNNALANGSECLYISANAANNRKRVSSIVLTYTEPSVTINYYGNNATGVGSASGATAYNPKSNLTETVTYSSSYSSFNLYNVASLFVRTGHHRYSEAQAWRVGSSTATTYMSEASADFTSYLKNGTTSVNLYANWASNTGKVLWNTRYGTVGSGYTLNSSGWVLNSSTNAVVENTATWGGTVTTPSASSFNGLTRTGYTLAGWKAGPMSNDMTITDDKLWGDLLSPGTSYTASLFPAMQSQDQTVANTNNFTCYMFAVWEANTYKISYNAYGGTGAPSPTTYTYSESGTINISSIIPVRFGYEFVGWRVGSATSSSIIPAGASFSLSTASNTTLYAIWRNVGRLNYGQSNEIKKVRLYVGGSDGTPKPVILYVGGSDNKPKLFIE